MCHDFSDSTPLVFFVAAEEGIRLFEVAQPYANCFNPSQDNNYIEGVETMYSSDTIVFKKSKDGYLYRYVFIFNVLPNKRKKGDLQ